MKNEQRRYTAMDEGAEQVRGEVPQTRTGRREYWSGHVQQWRSSGITQREYCDEKGISLERFGTWKRRLDREGQSGVLVAVPSRIVSSVLHASPALRLVV
jgi:hypothetical protein